MKVSYSQIKQLFKRQSSDLLKNTTMIVAGVVAGYVVEEVFHGSFKASAIAVNAGVVTAGVIIYRREVMRAVNGLRTKFSALKNES